MPCGIVADSKHCAQGRTFRVQNGLCIADGDYFAAVGPVYPPTRIGDGFTSDDSTRQWQIF